MHAERLPTPDAEDVELIGSISTPESFGMPSDYGMPISSSEGLAAWWRRWDADFPCEHASGSLEDRRARAELALLSEECVEIAEDFYGLGDRQYLDEHEALWHDCRERYP